MPNKIIASESGTDAAAPSPPAASKPGHEHEHIWELRLYVAGQTPKSIAAFHNLKKICQTYLKEHYQIEVIDLKIVPYLAKQDRIVAIPTLIRKAPEPSRRLVGDLSDETCIVRELNLTSMADWRSMTNAGG